MIKIIILRNAQFDGYGGAEAFPINLASKLQKLGQSVVICSAHDKLLAEASVKNIPSHKTPWIRVRDWHGWKTGLLPIYIVWQIYLTAYYILLFIKERPDVVHPQSRDDFIAASIAGRLLHKRVVWTDHADLKYELLNVAVWHKNFLGKLILFSAKYADVITLVSENDKKEISKSIGSRLDSKLHVIHNGVVDQLSEISPIAAQEKEFIFGTASRILKTKGIEELILAFYKLNQTFPDTSLWLVGDGVDMEYMKGITKNTSSVHFYGHKNNPLEYVASFDVFVQASYMEGFSVALVEAAMLAKPVVATAVGGNVELIQDQVNGLLVQPRNVDQLYKAMKTLYENNETVVKFSKNIRKTYENELNFSKIVAEKFIPIYEGSK